MPTLFNIVSVERDDAEALLAIHNSNLELLPTLRIKVEYSSFDTMRIQRIEQKFYGVVANEG